MDTVFKDYKFVSGRKPVKGDTVYVRSQNEIYKVIEVEAMNVKVERKHKGSGLYLTLPPSQYQIIEKK